MQSDRATDATEHADAPIVGVVCGTCLEGIEADHVPTWCRACHARFDRCAPYATVHFGARVAHGAVRLDLTAKLRHLEAWSEEGVEHVRALVE